MKSSRPLAAILGLLTGLFSISACAADPPRDANAILKEYNDVLIEQQRKVQEAQNRLALELYENHPQHPRAIPMMVMRWNNLGRTRDAAKAVAEMEKFLTDNPNSKERPNVLYARAMALANSPTSNAKKVLAAVDEFIAASPKDPRGSSLLSMVAMRTANKTEQLAIYRRIVAEYANSPAARSAAGALRKLDAIGKPVDLTFTDAVTGKTISMKALQGKVVVLDFWATWCGPCIAEMPKMKDLYAKYKPQGVEFIGISLDQPGEGLNKLKTYVAENEINWPQYYQGNGWQSEFSSSWGINAIPAVFIIDAKGNLYSTEARGKLDKLIPELIKKRDG